jgi:hypothetical protein
MVIMTDQLEAEPDESGAGDSATPELFGLWKGRGDTEDVAAYVRTLRRGRTL